MTAKEGGMGVHNSVRNHADWPRLARLTRDLAFLDGGSDTAFTLASGRQSRWFFDTKPVMMHPEAASIMGELLNQRIQAMGASLVGGLELGAVPLTAIVIASPKADEGLVDSWSESPPKAEAGAKQTTHPGLRGPHWKAAAMSLSLKT